MSDTQMPTTGNKPGGLSIFTCLLLCWLCVTPVDAIDKSKYITIDEVRTDMEAYCFTVFESNRIEKFDLKVLSVVRNWRPKRDAILVLGTDERFRYAGTIHGCSGSPVYIDGRLAGALASGWDGSKDPLYMVTPIEDMLKIGTAKGQAGSNGDRAVRVFDPSGAIDPDRVCQRLSNALAAQSVSAGGMQSTVSGLTPLVTSFPASVCGQLAGYLGPMGFTPVAAGGTYASPADKMNDDMNDPFAPGSVIAVPLLSGDMSMAATGTVTEVIGKKVYAFGHSFFGTGPVEMPIATGTVHVVVPGILNAFKFSTTGPIVGTLRFDEISGIMGVVGPKPKMIPLTITVDRYNDPERKIYNCQLAIDHLRSPLVLQLAIIAAASMHGALPPEHTVKYDASVAVAGWEAIRFKNISSGSGALEVSSEVAGTVGMIMNNRYEQADIRGVNVNLDITAKDIQTVIRSVELSDTVLKAGDTVDITVLLQSYMTEKTVVEFALTIPADLKPGSYDIIITGAEGYEKYMRKMTPQKFTAYDLPTMLVALQSLLSIQKSSLFAVITLPAGGVSIQQTELDYLPATRAMLLQDAKRTTTAQSLKHYVKKELPTRWVVLGSKTVKITVEQ